MARPYKKREGDQNVKDRSPRDFVNVSIKNLNIRKGPGKEFDRTGEFTGPGTFELVARKNGFGKLKSGKGWVCLDFCEDIKSDNVQTEGEF